MTNVLILGATGSVGHAITRALAKRRDLSLRALHRHPETVAQQFTDLPAIDWRQGDLMNLDDAIGAADGCDVIVHAVNPPGYARWRELALPMLERTIAAAKTSGATLVFPGNVYNFTPDIGHNVSETAPQQPATEKGRVRVEMEAMLRQAAAQGVRVILVRAGDFYGPDSGMAVFNFLVKRDRPVTKMLYPGALNVDHAWAYLPDLGETFAQLIERRADLPAYADFHFAGHTMTGTQLLDTMRQVTQNDRVNVGGFPWWLFRLIAPFNPMFKGMLEMRYLWHKPLTLDNAKLVAVLGQEPHTPLTQAVETSLRTLNSLPNTATHQTA
ncbi:NAD(P)H-binding protein [Saccharospirillum mangrovi]|uniref:NAD(P)H-binding protein n=1 Tax=Saccharospirillum mangrovi TaxID=2161747 RepID=UPI000D37148A|nr:NAD(P)H-binding protein [Saccharospirillum mangrovi]